MVQFTGAAAALEAKRLNINPARAELMRIWSGDENETLLLVIILSGLRVNVSPNWDMDYRRPSRNQRLSALCDHVPDTQNSLDSYVVARLARLFGLSARPRHLGLSVTGFSAQSSKKRRRAAGRKDSTRQDTTSDSDPLIGQEAPVGTGVSGPHCSQHALPLSALSNARPATKTGNRKPPIHRQPLPPARARSIRARDTHTLPGPSGHARVVRALLPTTSSLGHRPCGGPEMRR